MPDMDENVNVDLDPEEALRLLLATKPLEEKPGSENEPVHDSREEQTKPKE